MREGWEYRKLGEVCQILDSKRKPITKSKRESGNIPYYGATGLLDYVKDYIFDEKLLLLGEDGAKWGAGEDSAYIVSGKTWVNNHAHVLKPIDASFEYLAYYLKMADLSSYITGVTVPKLNQEKMRSIEIYIPNSLSEQQRIVTYLDSSFSKIDELKENVAKELSDAKALFQAELKRCMEKKEGWEEKKLGEVCNIVGRIGFRGYTRKDIVNDANEGAISISPSNINDGKMDFSNCTYISWFKYEESPEIMIYEGDILLVKTGSSYGKSAYVDNLPHKATINPQSVVLKDIKINNKYLAYFIRNKDFLKCIEEIVSGSAIPTFSQSNLGKIAIYFPPISTQHLIVTHLDTLSQKIQELEKNYNTILAECDTLKQAILKETFE